MAGPWPPPGHDATGLARTVHRLRRIPLSELSAEDIRILLGQRDAVPVLLPIALDMIDLDPLAAGDVYPGALLAAVLRAVTVSGASAADSDRLRAAIEHIREREDGSVPAELWERADELGLS